MSSKKRAIDSSIRKSQTFARLTFQQRDLWHGLIAVADDQGRLPGVPAYVRAQVWPYQDIELSAVASDLATLENIGNILVYQIGGQTFIQIVNWWKYQAMQWAGPSDYPAPDGWIDRTRYHAEGNKMVSANWDTPGGFMIPAQPAIPLPSELPSRLPSKQGRALSRRDVNDDVNGEDEGEVKGTSQAEIPWDYHQKPSAAAPAVSSHSKIIKIIASATGIMAIPPNELARVEQIHSLLDAYGESRVEQAMKQAYKTWISTPRKDGSGTYRGTNFGWVDWAQDLLQSAGAEIEKDWTKMNQKELIAYLSSLGAKK